MILSDEYDYSYFKYLYNMILNDDDNDDDDEKYIHMPPNLMYIYI